MVHNVLVVDDDPAYQAVVRTLLTDSANEGRFVLRAVFSAEEAVEVIASGNAFDVVLLDYALGGMDGPAFLEWMRTEEIDLPVIAVSAIGELKVVQRFLRQGIDDFISKEELTQPRLLVEAIERAIEKRDHRRTREQLRVARERMEAIQTLVRTIHHELNNPLAVLKLVASSLAKRSALSPERYASYAEMIIETVDRIVEVTKGLEGLRAESFDENGVGPQTYALVTQESNPENGCTEEKNPIEELVSYSVPQVP